MGFRTGQTQDVWAVVPYSPELIRRPVGCDPLLHREQRLRAVRVDPGGSDLDVVYVPAVMGPRPVRSYIDGANGLIQAWTSTAENVEIAPFEVVVTRLH